MTDKYIISEAVFSHDRKYRYLLYRMWSYGGKHACFIMLNPSTADENQDDPTITRCVNFSKKWGCGSMSIVNLFSFCATDPKDLFAEDNPIGPKNNKIIMLIDRKCDLIIAAWGNYGSYLSRSKEVMDIMNSDLHCLKINSSGQPSHPLYLKNDLMPMMFKSND